MSAKWRAPQHCHRYTYSAVVFPRSYVDSLNQLRGREACSKFCTKLRELISLNSTYSQVNYAKDVASAFGDLLLHGDEAVYVFEAVEFYRLERRGKNKTVIKGFFENTRNYRTNETVVHRVLEEPENKNMY